MTETLVAQLARAPIPGRVKTRLQPTLSPGEAADLHAAMVRHICCTLCDSNVGTVELWVEGDAEHALFRECRGLGVSAIRRQVGRDLGERMATICVDGLARSRTVVLVGSDVPGLDRHYLEQAAASLQRSEVVLGPALDGGYVLLGLARPVPEIFQNMPWGGSEVLALTRQRLDALQLSYELLPPLPDIDRPEDLVYLPEELSARLTASRE